jgi:hypothetical protein
VIYQPPEECINSTPDDAGAVYFDMDEGEGKPSRWNTLRAMRVLHWYEQPAAPRV